MVLNLHYQEALPDIQTFIDLRVACGWGRVEEHSATTSLKNSFYSICCYDGEKLVGFGRLVGDGVLYFYIQDMIVVKAYQGQGVGAEICRRLIGWVKANSSPGAMIGLLSAKHKEGFYQRFGFVERPSEVFGAGMILEL